jgi:hypothetical protein
LVSDRPATASGEELRSCYPCFGVDLARARACEQVVFGRRFGNSADELAQEYGPFEASTTFGAVFAADDTAVGAVRLVRPGPEPVKTLQDASRPPWNARTHVVRELAGFDETRTWDVASFGVDSVVAGADRRAVLVLLGVMFGAFADNEATSFVAMLDSNARRKLETRGIRMLNLPGTKPAPYLGSPSSVPVYRHLADLHFEHASKFPQIHQQVFHGRGLNGLDAQLNTPGSSVPVAAVQSGWPLDVH